MVVVVFPGGHIRISSIGIVYWWLSQTWCQQTKSWCVKTCWRPWLRWEFITWHLWLCKYLVYVVQPSIQRLGAFLFKKKTKQMVCYERTTVVNMHLYTQYHFAYGSYEHKSLMSRLRSQICSSSARQRSSSELGRLRIWRRSGQISFAQPVSKFRRLFEVGCRESDTERFA